MIQSSKQSSSFQGLVRVHLSAVLFGLSGIFGALALVDARLITFGRAFFAFVVLGIVLTALKISFKPKIKGRLLFLLASGLSLSVHWATFFMSIQASNAAIAALGFASFPAFIILIEVFFLKGRFTVRDVFILGMICVGLILINPPIGFDHTLLKGLLIGIVSGIAFAVFAVLNRQLVGVFHPFALSFWQNIIVSLCLLPWAFVHIPQAHFINWWWIFCLGVFCTALCHYLFVSSLHTVSVRTAGVIISLEPVYTILFAWILFALTPHLSMLIGALFIVLAAFVPQRKS